jgi:hypothetical protein
MCLPAEAMHEAEARVTTGWFLLRDVGEGKLEFPSQGTVRSASALFLHGWGLNGSWECLGQPACTSDRKLCLCRIRAKVQY